MNKMESLAFLQSCIDSVNMATSKELELLEELYVLNCTEPITSSNFEFVSPVGMIDCVSETIQKQIFETKCAVDRKKVEWNYNFEGICINNEQNDDNLPYAA